MQDTVAATEHPASSMHREHSLSITTWRDQCSQVWAALQLACLSSMSTTSTATITGMTEVQEQP